MLSKFIPIIMLFILCSLGLTAQSNTKEIGNKREALIEKTSKMSKEEFKNAYKQKYSRKPSTEQLNKQNSLSKKIAKPQEKKKTKNPNKVEKVNLPSDIIFPGEFEEVKAALITWPYMVYDTAGQISEQIFKDLGIYVDEVKQEAYLGPIISVIDTFQNSPLSPVFCNLAHAIDTDAEVWINVWNARDTATIINYMASKSLPLQHSRFFINPGNQFWYRDCGPVAFYYGNDDSVGFVDFEYYPGRPLDDSIPILIARNEGYPVFTSSVGYEGGNILLDGLGNLFTTNAVYSVNQIDKGQFYMDSTGEVYQDSKAPLSSTQVNDSLKYLLNLKSLRVLPSLVNDGGTGHIDLYADLFDENYFVFSQYPDQMKTFADYRTANRNIDTLMSIVRADGDKYRKWMIPFPKKDDGSWYTSAKEYGEQYTRSYSNHLLLNKTIVQPVFADGVTGDNASLQKDLDSLRSKYPGYKIMPIDVRSFDGFGGAIHCITKQIPADNPIRIYHTPIYPIVKTATIFPISASISNKSGIKSAVCKWRYKGTNNWTDLIITEGSTPGVFAGNINNSQASGTIEYYITATSNNGKTISKPITAPDGFYTFAFSENVSVEDNNSNSEIIGSFYPNPANEHAIVNINAANQNISITLSDASSNIVYSNTFVMQTGYDALSINTALLSSGTYHATFKLANGTVCHRSLVVIK
jgi:agmatine/peptidylarginine deiminase